MDLFIIYLICFGVGLLFTLVSAFFAHSFGGHDGHLDHAGTGGHAEAGYGTNDMPGFAAVSPTTIAAFITAFGGFGMIFSKIEATRNPWISAPLSALAGLLVAAGVVWLFRTVFRKTQSSSEGKVGNLVGVVATVITPVPENGVGEIAYVQGGTRYTAPARVEHGQPLANGSPARITRIVGSQFYVTAA